MDTYIRKGAARTVADGALAGLAVLPTTNHRLANHYFSLTIDICTVVAGVVHFTEPVWFAAIVKRTYAAPPPFSVTASGELSPTVTVESGYCLMLGM